MEAQLQRSREEKILSIDQYVYSWQLHRGKHMLNPEFSIFRLSDFK